MPTCHHRCTAALWRSEHACLPCDIFREGSEHPSRRQEQRWVRFCPRWPWPLTSACESLSFILPSRQESLRSDNHREQGTSSHISSGTQENPASLFFPLESQRDFCCPLHPTWLQQSYHHLAPNEFKSWGFWVGSSVVKLHLCH